MGLNSSGATCPCCHVNAKEFKLIMDREVLEEGTSVEDVAASTTVPEQRTTANLKEDLNTFLAAQPSATITSIESVCRENLFPNVPLTNWIMPVLHVLRELLLENYGCCLHRKFKF